MVTGQYNRNDRKRSHGEMVADGGGGGRASWEADDAEKMASVLGRLAKLEEQVARMS